MRIVHISDWHASIMSLPMADLYVCTGDMMPDFPLLVLEKEGQTGTKRITWDPQAKGSIPERSHVIDRIIEKERSYNLQLAWQRKNPARKNMGIPDDAPVIVVRGNHDFCDLAHWFGGNVWEVNDDPTRTTTINGFKVGGCRGINHTGWGWNDEFHPADFDKAVRQVPNDLDILITHSPPSDILDDYPSPIGRPGRGWGSDAIASYITRRDQENPEKILRAHMFGHVHERGGEIIRIHPDHETVFSNAAQEINEFDL